MSLKALLSTLDCCQSQPLQHIFLTRTLDIVSCFGSIAARLPEGRLNQHSSRHICGASGNATVLGEDRAKPTGMPAAVQDTSGVDASSDKELELDMPEPGTLDTRVSAPRGSMQGKAIRWAHG